MNPTATANGVVAGREIPGRNHCCPSIANGQEMSMLASVIGLLQQESIHPTPLASTKQQPKAEGQAGET